jgi:hypothetical protein
MIGIQFLNMAEGVDTFQEELDQFGIELLAGFPSDIFYNLILVPALFIAPSTRESAKTLASATILKKNGISSLLFPLIMTFSFSKPVSRVLFRA